MADLLQQGESLPDLELTTESGEHIGTGELTGQRTVLYFYPKDDTPGCTKEACAFRDRMNDYAKADIQVYGVSLDSPESHRTFREKYGLNFPLLTDEEGRASEALGVLGDQGKARRVTFLLDPEGRISKVYPEVSPQTHAEEILEDAASL
ncbi:Thiol peroxidase, Bcp-type [uncultured Rubrobacteraceae bacterium]|uniref:thioredoxin-dependent peroxiredoxin n=1 Tax=uncultured Rubrobacteraceae bacterium TaxID=349277 RepID=A0A6J4PWV2_9ACTN|nr:Thiol peroxidase, Bcp-type [uncultured Rubrobacteraceae bacterium]